MDFKTIKEEILFLDSLSNPTERDKQLSTEMQQLLQLRKADVSSSVCLDTELQIKLGELMQQVESSHCYMEKNKLRNKMSAICIILDINTFW